MADDVCYAITMEQRDRTVAEVEKICNMAADMYVPGTHHPPPAILAPNTRHLSPTITRPPIDTTARLPSTLNWAQGQRGQLQG